MRKGFIHFAIKERKVTLFIVIILIAYGFYSYTVTPKEEAPKIYLPYAIVTAVYPGTSPTEIEMQVTRKIEEKFTEIKGYQHTTTYSYNSIVTAVLELEYGTDTDKAWVELRNKMEDLEKELPEGCDIVDVNTELTKAAGFLLSVSGKAYSNEALDQYAQEIEEALSEVDHVAEINILGAQEKQIEIRVDHDKLNFLPLSIEDVMKLIYAQSVEIPLGRMNYEEQKINITSNGRYQSLEELENTILGVSPQNGETIRLKDIASVNEISIDSSFIVQHNGEEAILLAGYFEQEQNIVSIGENLDAQLKAVMKDLPSDIHVDKVLFQPNDVDTIISDFMINLLIGMLFVIIVVFISMGFRNALIVSTAIPISIMLTFIAMNLIGIEFHKISIATLIIALGMLVDNAIVVSDSIQALMDEGKNRFEACVEGTKSIAVPVLSSTLTTVSAFLPLLLMKSIVGAYIISIPQIIMISLSISYGVAMLITPTLAYIFLRPKKKKSRKLLYKNGFMKTLGFALKHRAITLGTIILFIGLTGYLISQLGLQFFPTADKDLIYINVSVDKGNDFNLTKEITKDITNIIEEQAEVIEYTTSIGGGLPKFWDTMGLTPKSMDKVQILIKLDLEKGGRFENNSEFCEVLQNQIDQKVEGGTISVKQLEQGIPMSAPLTALISGKDIDEVAVVSETLLMELKEIEGTMNVRTNQAKSFDDLKLQIDTDKASSMGLTKAEIQKEIRFALEGDTAAVLNIQDSELDIHVKSDITNWEELSNLKIKSNITGEKVLLKEIADVEIVSQPAVIQRYDGAYNINLLSDIKSGYSSIEIQKVFKERMDELDLGDVEISFDGEKENIEKNFSDVGIKSIFALLAIFIILLIQFNSFSQPFIVLITIPLSSIGAIIGLYIFGQSLSFTAILGLVSLFGIVVNNAIILIDFINRERQEGKTINEACMDAIDKRIRPILLTTTTTVIGLVPLITMGSELFSPMAIAIACGLLFSTILTLIFVPVVYSLVGSKRMSGEKV